MINNKDLLNRFSYHNVDVHQTNKMADLREKLHELAIFCSKEAPQSRELALALTKLEEAMFWVNAAIARNNENGEHD